MSTQINYTSTTSSTFFDGPVDFYEHCAPRRYATPRRAVSFARNHRVLSRIVTCGLTPELAGLHGARCQRQLQPTTPCLARPHVRRMHRAQRPVLAQARQRAPLAPWIKEVRAAIRALAKEAKGMR